MKNRIALLGLLIVQLISAKAQFKKGDSFGNIGLSGSFTSFQQKASSGLSKDRTYAMSMGIGLERFVHPMVSLAYGAGLEWNRAVEHFTSSGGSTYTSNLIGLNAKLGINHYHPIKEKLYLVLGAEAQLMGNIEWLTREPKVSFSPQNLNNLTQSYRLSAGLVSPINEDVFLFIKLPVFALIVSNSQIDSYHYFSSKQVLELQGGLSFRLSAMRTLLNRKRFTITPAF